LLRAGNNLPDDLRKLASQACSNNAENCGVVEAQYRDVIHQFVTPVVDEAIIRWKKAESYRSKRSEDARVP
jgi:hypothetical protein